MEMQRLSKEIFSFWFQASTSLKKAKKSIPSREILQQYYFFIQIQQRFMPTFARLASKFIKEPVAI